MKKSFLKITFLLGLGLLSPLFCHAEGVADDIHSLQSVLDQLYNQMIPLCSQMIGISRAIAGFGALWFIAAKIWKHMAAAEPIDVYPLLRPFALGFCIAFFPMVLSLMNGVLQPVVTITHNMVTNSNQAIARMLDGQSKPEQNPGSAGMNSDPDKWYQYSHPDGTTNNTATGSTNMADQFSGWGWKNMVKKAIAEILNVMFEAAALCIDTIRTFKLIVLAILGPLCFGLSIFEGFQHTLKQWIARYVNVFMWLPVANIFGAIIAKIQENMIYLQQSGNLGGNEFANSNTVYLIFMLIGIVGYFTVPSIAGYIMNVGGHALFNKTSAMASMATSFIGGTIMQSMLKNSTTKNQQGNNTTNTGGNQPAIKSKLTGKT